MSKPTDSEVKQLVEKLKTIYHKQPIDALLFDLIEDQLIKRNGINELTSYVVWSTKLIDKDNLKYEDVIVYEKIMKILEKGK